MMRQVCAGHVLTLQSSLSPFGQYNPAGEEERCTSQWDAAENIVSKSNYCFDGVCESSCEVKAPIQLVKHFSDTQCCMPILGYSDEGQCQDTVVNVYNATTQSLQTKRQPGILLMSTRRQPSWKAERPG